jgi:hypothetical protein
MLSLNAIIANRASGTFSADPYKAVDELISFTLDKLAINFRSQFLLSAVSLVSLPLPQEDAPLSGLKIQV